ncbi:MAG: tetratricopeptide repeat protein [Bacteroidales bacterium]|nr:tetratricopeptide repeat protein [Bacteroidales bacterium]
MAKKKSKAEDGIVKVEEALSKTEKFIESNQKLLTIVIGAIIVVVLAFFGINRFYMTPREQEAKEQMFMAERYFEMDSLNLALNGDGMYPGFLEIIDDYRWTKGANLSKYYAGICYLKLGDAQEASSYLKSYKGKDEIIGPMAKGALADAYMELGQQSKAAGTYLDAARLRKNDFTTPLFLMKAAGAYEIINDFKKALPVYEQIKKEFPNSIEAREIDKYIARAKGMM